MACSGNVIGQTNPAPRRRQNAPVAPMARMGRAAGAARATRGFTLLEIMLVVVIIGLLATVAITAFGGRTEAVRRQTTMSQLRSIKSALEQYNGQYATYPANLGALAAGAEKFLERLPKDGWKNDFIYIYPGSSGDPERPFDLASAGRDKTPSTGDDIDVWTMDNQP